MSERRQPLRRSPIVLASLLVVAFLAALIVFQRYLVVPKLVMVAVIVLVALLMGSVRPLLRDWAVFIGFIYLCDSLRGMIYILICKLQVPVRALYIMNFEKALFGGVPSVSLQHALLRTDALGNVGWPERVLTVVYGSHFIAFLLVGLIIWVYRSEVFSLYKTSFYLLSGVGVLLYFVIPTVPPWIAANHFGLLPALNHFNINLVNLAIPGISSGFDTNPIAAMPSLHAGFPILCSLLLARLFRWKALPFHLYTLAILFTIVYTGDHYVTDVLAGLALAVGFYLVATRLAARPGTTGTVGPGVPVGSSALKRRVLLGLGVLLVGVAIGGVNKTQFNLRANSYGLDVPRYVDFFRDLDRYKDSYLVQDYLGRHFAARKDHRAALGYFEASLRVARTPQEADEARSNIRLCRQALRLGN